MDTVLCVRTSLLATAGRLSWLPPTLARLAVGVVFAGTGWGKLHHLDKITSFFADLGIPAPGFNAVLVGSAELIFGVLLLIGLFTRLASLPLIVVMAVAILTAKRADIGGLADLLGFEETLYVVLLSWLAIAGPGPISLDRLVLRLLGRTSEANGPASQPVPAHN